MKPTLKNTGEKVGNIFQNFNLVNSYTVYQNVELALMLNGETGADMKERSALS